MTSANKNPAGMASPTRGLLVHGGDPVTNVIDFITIATAGNAQDFGDTTIAMEGAMAGPSSTTRGVIAGGMVLLQRIIQYHLLRLQVQEMQQISVI